MQFKKRRVNQALLNQYGDDVSEFLKPIFASRNTDFYQLNLALSALLPPNFANLGDALDILAASLIQQKRILIIGDFDADGATASALLIKALRQMGGRFVDFLVPNRFVHGYGLSTAIVKLAIKDKCPDLIITVDNGISSFDGVQLAKKEGIKVIITDHHLPSHLLPKADAIINPNLVDCSFESKNLAGVGVAFYLCLALKSYLTQKKYFHKQNIAIPDLRYLLDLVALGTVADMVKLDQNNRILVKSGLDIINKTKGCVGIDALTSIAKKSTKNLTASDLSFALAPRINAAGRLKDISIGIRLLVSEDLNIAMNYAAQLNEYNQSRRTIQDDIQTQAETALAANDNNKNRFSICLYDKNWHEGIIGIVAGKLSKQYHCPVAVFANNNNSLKGSLRSIDSVHIKDLLTEINDDNPNLIDKFGGHAAAAGMSMKTDNFEKFSKIFKKTIRKKLNNIPPNAILLTDGELLEWQIHIKNAQLIADNAPWGQGFEEPVFQGIFSVHNQKIVGEAHLKCQLKLKNGKYYFDAIAFFQQQINQDFALIAYKLDINNYRGMQSLQLIIEKIAPIS